VAEQVLTDFIRALRSADVRVSTGEAIDAAEAVKLIGYADRQRLLDTLRCVLAKSPTEKVAHDRLFDLYFSRQAVPPSDPPPETNESEEEDASDGPGDMLDLLESGDETAIAMAMERAGQEAGLQEIRFSTQVAYYAQQMMKSLGVERLESEMMDAFRERTEDGQARAEALIEGRKDMFGRARGNTRKKGEEVDSRSLRFQNGDCGPLEPGDPVSRNQLVPVLLQNLQLNGFVNPVKNPFVILYTRQDTFVPADKFHFGGFVGENGP
jgi:uncharacterized protein with von Willebrand factor type A (vWA) domain